MPSGSGGVEVVAYMDLRRTIEQLIEERNRVDAIIKSLEVMSGIHGTSASKKRRGRKFMDEAARKEVSVRMKKYWARRRGKSIGVGSVNAPFSAEPAMTRVNGAAA